MGNTVLAHVLYSTRNKDFDLDTFFSKTGNAHKIRLRNYTELTAEHLQEYPNKNLKCVIELTSDKWYEVLRYKMSYSKWHNDFPTRLNYKKFFKDVQISTQESSDWKDFYDNIRDPSWPECDSYEMIHTLDDRIKNEILNVYQLPMSDPSASSSLFLEILSQTYFNMLTAAHQKVFPTSETYYISDYFLGNTTALENMCLRVLGWKWDHTRSIEFLSKVLEINAKYFVWLDNIKNIYQNTIELIECSVQLELWEQALLIAKCCEYFKIAPSNLNWHDEGCVLDENNVLLVKLLKRLNHGKTI
jgi:hypothetical protein